MNKRQTVSFLLGIYVNMMLVTADGLQVTLDNDSCGQEFSLNDGQSVTLNYDGGSVLQTECRSKFTLDDYDYEICAQPELLNLDCGTEITYHTFVVSEYFNDGKLTCGDNHTDDIKHCVRYYNIFYVVITQETFNRSERAVIRVYAKGTSTSYTFSETEYDNTLLIAMPIISTAVTFITICTLCLCIKIRNQRQQRNTETVIYTTTVNAPNTESVNQPGYPQTGFPQPGVPGTIVQAPTGGYHVHPMVTAVPNQTQPAPSQYGNQPLPYNNPLGLEPQQTGGKQHVPYNNPPGLQTQPEAVASASSQGDHEMPPPSYDNLAFK